MNKKISLVIMATFYFVAGINHFRNPEAYYKIIPYWLTNTHFINISSGLSEIVLAILLLIPRTRKFACYGIILMLIAFIPAHIQMIKTGWCIKDFCFPPWAIRIRLVLFQPLLIYWAFKNRK